MSSGFGPGFQSVQSKLYRAEYAIATLVIIAYLLWRTLYLGGVDWIQTVFWVLFSDIVAFVPIGLSSNRKEWPRWGSTLYNLSHTAIIWSAAFAAVWVAFGVAYLPLLGWLGHITADRAFGFGLRAGHKPSQKDYS